MRQRDSVTHDLDRDIRNTRTKDLLAMAGIDSAHVLTTGKYEPTLVLFESGRDALKGVQIMRDAGWDVDSVGHGIKNPPAYWVRHPSPFAPTQGTIRTSRTFPVDSPCPQDVEYAQHQNGVVFRRIDYGFSERNWRAMSEHDGDGSEHTWQALNGSNGDASPMVEVFLMKGSDFPIEDLRNPIWRAVEAVVTRERLARAERPNLIADLVYEAVVAAQKAAGKG